MGQPLSTSKDRTGERASRTAQQTTRRSGSQPRIGCLLGRGQGQNPRGFRTFLERPSARAKREHTEPARKRRGAGASPARSAKRNSDRGTRGSHLRVPWSCHRRDRPTEAYVRTPPQEGSERGLRETRCYEMAERGGFEPPAQVTPGNCLAGSPVQPLQHLSAGLARCPRARSRRRAESCRRRTVPDEGPPIVRPPGSGVKEAGVRARTASTVRYPPPDAARPIPQQSPGDRHERPRPLRS